MDSGFCSADITHFINRPYSFLYKSKGIYIFSAYYARGIMLTTYTTYMHYLTYSYNDLGNQVLLYPILQIKI